MKSFFRFVSFILHPILIPIAGTVTYFLITPKYSPAELQAGNILPVFILTVIIPLICILILKNLGVISSVFLPSLTDRIYPLIIGIILLTTVVVKVLPTNYTIELYYFFVGLISSAAACLLLVILKYKSSLHLAGMGSLLMFLIALSIHFEINITIAIGLWTIASGLAATATLYLKIHSRAEMLIGFLIGFISQLLTIQFWL